MLEIATVVGGAILPHVSALARLRRIVFRDWPYLYDGDDAYEAEYLATYARCPQAALAIAWNGAEPVGMSSCLPLRDETGNVVAPFRAAVEAGAEAASRVGELVSAHVIPRPDPAILRTFLGS